MGQTAASIKRPTWERLWKKTAEDQRRRNPGRRSVEARLRSLRTLMADIEALEDRIDIADSRAASEEADRLGTIPMEALFAELGL